MPKQKTGEVSAKRLHQQNAQRRQHQRMIEARNRFVESLAQFVECPASEIPRYAKIHGIPLYQG